MPLECRVSADGHSNIAVYHPDKPVRTDGTDGRFVLIRGDIDAAAARKITAAIHALKSPSPQTKQTAAIALAAHAGMDNSAAEQLVESICTAVSKRKKV